VGEGTFRQTLSFLGSETIHGCDDTSVDSDDIEQAQCQRAKRYDSGFGPNRKLKLF